MDKILGRGKTNGLMVIVDFPSSLNWKKRQVLWGDEERLLLMSLKSLGLEGMNVWTTYAVKTETFKSASPLQLATAKRELIDEIVQVKPKKILALGMTSYAVLRNMEKTQAIDNTRGFSERREFVSSQGEIHECYVVYSIPLYFMTTSTPERYRDFSFDLQKLFRQDISFVAPRQILKVVKSSRELYECMKTLSEATIISCDVETTGLNPQEDSLLAIGFGALSSDKSVGYNVVIPKDLVYNKEVKELVYDFLLGKMCDSTFVFHNGKFDLKFLTKYCGNSLLRIKFGDTILMNYVLDERPIGGQVEDDSASSASGKPHGLKAIARYRFDQEDYKWDFNKFYKTPEEERDYESLYQYLGLDLTYTCLTYWELKKEIDEEDPDLWNVLDKLLLPGSKAFAEIELLGIQIDRAHFQRVEKKLMQDLDDLMVQMSNLLTDAGIDAVMNKVNPNSHVQVKQALYDWLKCPDPKGKRVSDKEHLMQLELTYKGTPIEHFCRIISEYRTLSKALSTYTRGLMDSADKLDRVHCEFNLNGTATGRLSSSNPNLQNIPVLMGPVIREGFTARPGFVLAEVDGSQLELRIAALCCQDETLLKAFLDDRDIHTEVAAKAFNVPYDQVTYEQRYAAKYIDFGLLYGRTAHALATGQELMSQGWSTEQALDFIEKFFGDFPKLISWIEGQKEQVKTKQFVKSLTGRRRRWTFMTDAVKHHVQNESVNTPIQGLASDFILFMLIEIHWRLRNMHSKIVSEVHDSIILEIYEPELDKVAKMVKEVMTSHFPVPCNVPIKVDFEVGRNWGSLEKWHPGWQAPWKKNLFWYHPESDSWVETESGQDFDPGMYHECVLHSYDEWVGWHRRRTIEVKNKVEVRKVIA